MERNQGLVSLSVGRRAGVAARAALIVLLSNLVLQQLSMALNVGMMSAQGNIQNLYPLSSLPYLVGGFLLGPLAFVVGVFLSLWLLAPVTAELGIGRVIVRSLTATVAGGVAVLIIQLAASLFQNFDRSSGLVFGWIAGIGTTLSSNAEWAFSNALFVAVSNTIALIPLVVLACVVTWGWLRDRSAGLPQGGNES